MRPEETFSGRKALEKDFWEVGAAKLFTADCGGPRRALLAVG
jgi:hypothetical protein